MKQSNNSLEQFHRDCDTALDWIVRLRADNPPVSVQGDFALWLAQKPAHKQAMDHMLELWADLETINHLPDIEIASSNRFSRWWGAAAVAAAVVFAVLLLPTQEQTIEVLEYQTALGERQTFELPDQTQIMLNTQTLARVRYDENQRRVELVRGEAYFDVEKDPQRPFHVDIDGARVTAIGTAFNIHRVDDTTTVTVTEGVVQVSETEDGASWAQNTEVLHAGEQLTSTADGFNSRVLPATEAVIAWQQGKLIAQGMALNKLLGELARYHQQPIFLGSNDLGALTVSGIFDLDQLPATISALELSLNLQASELDSGGILLLNTPE